MSESLMMAPDPNPDFCTGLDSLPIPSIDELDFSFDDSGDFQIIFDELDGLLAADTGNFPVPDAWHPGNSAQGAGTPEPSSVGAPENFGRNLDSSSSDISCSNRESPQNSIDRISDVRAPDSSQGSRSWGAQLLDQRLKSEENGKIFVPKTNAVNGQAVHGSPNRKRPRSGEEGAEIEEDEEKRKTRLMRNRESAQLSRQRKKQYVEDLEEKVRVMKSTIAELNCKVSYIMSENLALRQQLSGSGRIYPPPATPMPYPWPLWGPYMGHPHTSQMPRVPIPRSKPKQPVSCSKAKKSRKTERKTQKVASVTLLGVLLFMLLFGGLVPFVKVNYGETSERFDRLPGCYGGDCCYDQHRDRVLMVDGHSNISVIGFSGNNIDGTLHPEQDGSSHLESTSIWNSSESLFASLYVPKDNKLVKLDGKLTINSHLATEEVMGLEKVSEMNHNHQENTGLPISEKISSALAIQSIGRAREVHRRSYGNVYDQLKAFASGSDDQTVQQWFHESIVGPMLSSGQCTEVFQFDVSPLSTSGAVVPASSAANVTAQHKHRPTPRNITGNRRVLRELRTPLPTSGFFNTSKEQQPEEHSGKEYPQWNKRSSSIVVSVLADLREVGDGDAGGMMAPKSFSRIFVVVLLDSVKYVTYSCMLQRSGLHLVTA